MLLGFIYAGAGDWLLLMLHPWRQRSVLLRERCCCALGGSDVLPVLSAQIFLPQAALWELCVGVLLSRVPVGCAGVSLSGEVAAPEQELVLEPLS